MKKKVILLLLAAMTTATVLGGCGSATSTSVDETTTSASADVENASIDLITDWTAMATVSIDGEDVKIDGSGVTQSGDVLTITEGGAYTFSGTSEQICILVNTEEDVKIILDGVVLTNATGPAIYGENSESIYIETTEDSENVLSDGDAYDTDEAGDAVGKATIFSNDRLVFLGSGTLTVTGNYKHAICSDDDIYFESGMYDLTANVKDGVHANDLITVDGGTFTIDAVSDDMESEGDFVMNGGVLTGTSDDEGLESKAVMTINGGTINLTVVDDGLNATEDITINDGTITIKATTGDAIDSNGSMTINGGTVVAYGGAAPEGALDCDMAEVLINGGTVIAVGDENSAINEESAQASVLLGSYTSESVIAIVDNEGNEIFSFTLEDAKSNIIVSTSGLTSGETYTVTVDGEEDQSFTVDSMVISAGGSAGAMSGGMGGEMNGGPMGDGTMPSDGNMPSGGAPSDGNLPQMNNNTDSNASSSEL